MRDPEPGRLTIQAQHAAEAKNAKAQAEARDALRELLRMCRPRRRLSITERVTRFLVG